MILILLGCGFYLLAMSHGTFIKKTEGKKEESKSKGE